MYDILIGAQLDGFLLTLGPTGIAGEGDPEGLRESGPAEDSQGQLLAHGQPHLKNR